MRNLHNRIERLEGMTPPQIYGAAIVLDEGETMQDAKARHIAKHGPYEGNTLFVELVAYGEEIKP